MSSIEVNSDDSSINQHQRQYEDIAMKVWELAERTGEDFEYIPLLGNRNPPLDYRNIN